MENKENYQDSINQVYMSYPDTMLDEKRHKRPYTQNFNYNQNVNNFNNQNFSSNNNEANQFSNISNSTQNNNNMMSSLFNLMQNANNLDTGSLLSVATKLAQNNGQNGANLISSLLTKQDNSDKKNADKNVDDKSSKIKNFKKIKDID